MLFNSIPFLFFLPTAFIIYWLVGGKSATPQHLRVQNIFLIIASYLFYGWWDWRFLFLIFASSLADFVLGAGIDHTEDEKRRKLLLGLSLAFNLGVLGFFKYFNFFITGFTQLLSGLGIYCDTPTLRIILPVGISFYTFQTLSYSIDIYRRKIQSIRDPFAFFAFVSFFPQLVAGPIERASALLPQFQVPRRFNNQLARDGARQMLWGFFKKMVIADNMAPHVRDIFAGYESMDTITLILGAFFFAIQIYCDFSGYSDIAIGLARLFGFNLMRNFAYPYFSRDIAEFWRRWHISLSTWFRDYVYIPLGGSLCPRRRRIINVLLTFTVSGFWHGANWTFLFWGALNGLYYIPLLLRGRVGANTDTPAANRMFPSLHEGAAMAGTFSLTLLAWIFFRAENLGHAVAYIGHIFEQPWVTGGYSQFAKPAGLALLPLSIEWFQRNREHGLEIADKQGGIRWLVYVAIIASILILGNFGSQEFIYFQF